MSFFSGLLAFSIFTCLFNFDSSNLPYDVMLHGSEELLIFPLFSFFMLSGKSDNFQTPYILHRNLKSYLKVYTSCCNLQFCISVDVTFGLEPGILCDTNNKTKENLLEAFLSDIEKFLKNTLLYLLFCEFVYTRFQPSHHVIISYVICVMLVSPTLWEYQGIVF